MRSNLSLPSASWQSNAADAGAASRMSDVTSAVGNEDSIASVRSKLARRVTAGDRAARAS